MNNVNNESIAANFSEVMTELQKAIVGQRAVMEQTLVAFLAGGHVLVEGVPGLAKTLFAKALARTLSSSFRRIRTVHRVPFDVLREVLLLAGSAMAVTIPVAMLVTHAVRSQLFGVSVADPAVYALGIVTICVVASLAGFIPARRAANVDHFQMLRLNGL